MRLPNLHTAPMRHLINLELFLRKPVFIAKTKRLCDVLKVLYLAKFSEIWHRYTKQDKVSDHQLKITFQHSDFVRKALFFVIKDNPACLVKV